MRCGDTACRIAFIGAHPQVNRRFPWSRRSSRCEGGNSCNAAVGGARDIADVAAQSANVICQAAKLAHVDRISWMDFRQPCWPSNKRQTGQSPLNPSRKPPPARRLWYHRRSRRSRSVLPLSKGISPDTAIGSSKKSPPLYDERSNALTDQAIIDWDPVIAVVR